MRSCAIFEAHYKKMCTHPIPLVTTTVLKGKQQANNGLHANLCQLSCGTHALTNSDAMICVVLSTGWW